MAWLSPGRLSSICITTPGWGQRPSSLPIITSWWRWPGCCPGGADKSYGIHVAQLAGLPRAVTQRAQEVLSELEDGRRPEKTGPSPRKKAPPSMQLSLFAAKSPLLEALG